MSKLASSRRFRLILIFTLAFVVLVLFMTQCRFASAQGHVGIPAKDRNMQTRWAADVTPENVHREYPRPQLVRERWLNLNGSWDYALRPKAEAQPSQFDGSILVPFPVESPLSSVGKQAEPNQRLWYRRTFSVPADWAGQRVRLNFGAVDWETTVWVNAQAVGTHRGGYDPFSFDVTDALNASAQQEVIVSVWDPTETGTQPRGKQLREPTGMWHTPNSGIWQSVWLEPVPEAHIAGLRLTPDIDAQTLSVALPGVQAGYTVRARAMDGTQNVAEGTGDAGQPLSLSIPNPKLWSPNQPFLYDLEVSLLQGDTEVDRVKSYFGMRKISLGKDAQGTPRLFLNNKILFQYGPLDQGYWPDGLYTAPSDAALKYDLEMVKKLGFNMVRKHVKVEPERWYYWADKLGVLVWQDFPSGAAIAPKGPLGVIKRTPESAAQFELELGRMVETHRNHPSIVTWILFNEGWGEFDTVRLTRWLQQEDPTRLVSSASGWNNFGVGDLNDDHHYPGPQAPPQDPTRASVIGEFGGIGLSLPGYDWNGPDEGNWHHSLVKNKEALLIDYEAKLAALRDLIATQGVAAAVYTQLTDVEIEDNGFLTYDREIVKFDVPPLGAY